jgi:hypothetical protein
VALLVCSVRGAVSGQKQPDKRTIVYPAGALGAAGLGFALLLKLFELEARFPA